MNQIIFLFLILVLAIGLPLFFKILETFNRRRDGFSNYTLAEAGPVPTSEIEVLVQDYYPRTNNNQISSNSAYDIWWHYPTFQVGSYDQITNNIRYSNNPDEGTCMPASMCGALYKEKQLQTNYVKPLPPVNSNDGTRVGYFVTCENLLPFRTDMRNI